MKVEHLTKEHIKEMLVNASNAYYNTDKLILSDEEYDKLNNFYINEMEGEPIIGSPPDSNKNTLSVSHEYENLAGTLEKTNKLEEAIKFIKELILKYPNKELKIILDLKFDGNSIMEEFSNGKLNQALTRGNNGKGMDLNHIFFDDEIKYKESIAVKYEAITTYKNLDIINEKENKAYVNPRNLISGLLGKSEARNYKKYITLVPLEVRIKDNNDFFKNLEILEELRKDLLKEIPYIPRVVISYDPNKDKDIDKFIKKVELEINNYYNLVISKRESLEFMIDGLVLSVLSNDILLDETYTNSIPSFMLAVKFPYLEKTTKVTKIEFEVSKNGTGRITPVCYFEPVEFNGTIHTKQSLQNYKRFDELKLGIGSSILIQYRNDCLSYIEPLAEEGITPIEFPTRCPICNELIAITMNDDVATLANCVNPKCKNNVIGKYNNFLIKVDVKNVKENTIEKLYENGLLTGSIQELYEIKEEEFINIQGLGQSTFDIIEKELKTKTLYDYEILGSLGIPNISLKTSKEFCKVFPLKDIIVEYAPNEYSLNISMMNIMNLDGFSDILSRNILDGIVNNIEDILFLLNNSKSIKKEIEENVKKLGNIESLNIVFTGFRDKEFKDKLELMGHKVTDSVSGKTNLVITKDPNSSSSKIKKAREKGIEIISPSEAKVRFK